jgi:hypothetical protein
VPEAPVPLCVHHQIKMRSVSEKVKPTTEFLTLSTLGSSVNRGNPPLSSGQYLLAFLRHLGFVGCNPMAWDERRARRLTREAEWELCRLRTKSHRASSQLSVHVELLMAEKRAAYETRNMERYERAIQALLHQARTL